MTQSHYPICTLDAIHEDICFLVSYFFYDTRKKKEYSLAEVSKKTGISIEDIDKLETMRGVYDFCIISRLIDFYQTKMPVDISCFPKLPKNIAKKCLA